MRTKSVKKFFFTLIILITTVGLAACGPKSTKDIQPVYLTSTDVELEGEELIMGAPFPLRVGDYLVISDFKSDSVLTIVNLKEGVNKGSFYRNGQGPDEYGNITILSNIPGSDNSFLISDPMKKTVTRVSLDDIDNGHLLQNRELKSDSTFWNILQLANEKYVTSNGYDRYVELFTIFNPDGTVAGHTGKRIIPEENSDYAPIDLTAAYQYQLSTTPDGKRIAGIGLGKQALFYQLRGDSLVLTGKIFDPKSEPQHIFTQDGYEGIDGDSKKPWGFVSGVASEEGVYILNSSHPFCEDNSWIDNQILLYSWEGNLMADYRIDRKVSHISAPRADGKMYAIVEDNSDPTLVVIELP